MKRREITGLIVGLSVWVSGPQTGWGADLFVYPLPGLLEQGQGPYWTVLQEVARRGDLQLDLVFYPAKRSFKNFFAKGGCCLADLAVMTEFEEQYQLIATKPLGGWRLYFFTLRDAPVVSSYGQIVNKRLGVLRGTEPELIDEYTPLAAASVHLVPVDGERQMIQLLRKGRVDAFLHALPDMNSYLPQIHYDANLVVHSGDDHIICVRSRANRDFVARFDRALKTMRDDGTYRAMMGDWYLEKR